MTPPSRKLRAPSRRRGITFPEVLAAMVLVGIVVPVATRAILTARRAGVEADRRRQAARLADRLLNTFVADESWTDGDQSGQLTDAKVPNAAPQGWRWQMTRDTWKEEPLSEITVEVFYQVQGVVHSVRVSTVVEEEQTTQ